MKIPFKYYRHFWLYNNALFTAFLGAISIVPPLVIFTWGLIGIHPFIFPLAHYVVFNFFFLLFIYIGGFQGDLEYGYMSWVYNAYANKKIIRKIGYIRTLVLRLDELSQFGVFRQGVYDQLIKDQELMSDQKFSFAINLKISKSLSRQGELNRELSFLKNALDICPNNIVANFLIGQCYERLGEKSMAVHSYRNAKKQSKISL